MNTKEENVLVKLVKKAVGLPTRDSTCGCTAPVAAASSCCGEVAEGPSTGCGCTTAPLKPEEHHPTEA